MFSRKLALAAFAVALSIAFAGCAKKSEPTPAAQTTTSDSSSAAAVTLFKANCVSCHGDNLEGRVGPNTNLTKVGARKTKDQIVAQIKNGGGGMIPFQGRLKDDEINAIAEWLATKK